MPLSALPAPVAAVLRSPAAVGFSGSRRLLPSSAAALHLAAAAVPPGVPVLVGCASGADALARSLFPAARVFLASHFGRGRGAFAARSAAFARALAAAGGVLLSFPAAACPAGLVPSASPSRCFCGSGSGSWASLALALGLGVPCAVFAPAGAPAGWGLESVGGGWFVAVPPPQLSLF